MSLNLHLPENVILKPRITVFGVGGAGGNAVNNMINASLEGVNFVAANTDAQALEHSMTENRVQLGAELTKGLGAGAKPEVGGRAAEEAMSEIMEYLEGCNMVFITAGMGGGTGTGAAPVIAKAAKDQGVLTVGVVTKPFHFEGGHRMRLAESGISELHPHVDTLIIIPNQNLFRIANERTTFADAFKMADSVLHAGVRGITDLMTMPGLINLDFADIRAVMSEMGKAMMGTGEADGEKRAIEAAEAAIANPLLDNVSMKGAHGVLINITGGPDMTLFEVDEAANRIREEVDPDANIIFGSTYNPELEGSLRVSVVATGIDAEDFQQRKPQETAKPKQEVVSVATPKPQQPVEPSINYHVSASTVTKPSVEAQQNVNAVSQQTQQPQSSAYEFEQNEVAVLEREPVKPEVEAFVPPRPVEPNFSPTVSDYGYQESQEEVEYQPNAAAPTVEVRQEQPRQEYVPQHPQHPAQRNQQVYQQQIRPPQQKMGLFSRMAAAAGVGLKPSRAENEYDTRRPASRNPQEEEQRENAIQQDIIDVPAYLRKKQDS